MCACFSLKTGLNKFFHTSAEMGILCITCVLEEVLKANSQNPQPTQFLRYFKYLLHIYRRYVFILHYIKIIHVYHILLHPMNY